MYCDVMNASQPDKGVPAGSPTRPTALVAGRKKDTRNNSQDATTSAAANRDGRMVMGGGPVRPAPRPPDLPSVRGPVQLRDAEGPAGGLEHVGERLGDRIARLPAGGGAEPGGVGHQQRLI